MVVMKSPALFKEYIWLINTIRRAGKISLAEINRRWVCTDMSGGVEFARTTFNRHKDAIEDLIYLNILYMVMMKCFLLQKIVYPIILLMEFQYII